MSKVKLIYISSDDCKACVDFSSKWENIKEILNQKIEIVEINLKTRREFSVIPKEYSEYVGWFPTFLLKVDDHVEIFNGEMIEGTPIMKEGFQRNLNCFKNWISLHSNIEFDTHEPNYACYAISAIAANVIVLNLIMWIYIL